MKKVSLVSLVVALAVVAAACGSATTAQDKEITSRGVTGLTLGDEKPELATPYTVEFWEDDYEGVNYYTVKDGEELILVYYPTYAIEVYSPEYKTAEGIAAGDMLRPSLEKMEESTGHTPTLEYYRDSADFYFNCGNGIYLVVAPASLEGGMERYNDWYLHSGDSNELNITDFSTDATIAYIKISEY